MGQHWVSPSYICRIVGGTPSIQEPGKCSAIAWFAPDDLPAEITDVTHANEVGSWWARGAQARPERSRRMDVVGVNRADHRVIFGEARWTKISARGRSTLVTTADLHALMEKGLLWLRGDTARWDVHYAFFARNVGEVAGVGSDEENVHLFTSEDVTSVNA